MHSLPRKSIGTRLWTYCIFRSLPFRATWLSWKMNLGVKHQELGIMPYVAE